MKLDTPSQGASGHTPTQLARVCCHSYWREVIRYEISCKSPSYRLPLSLHRVLAAEDSRGAHGDLGTAYYCSGESSWCIE